jgi:hypothetical protein
MNGSFLHSTESNVEVYKFLKIDSFTVEEKLQVYKIKYGTLTLTFCFPEIVWCWYELSMYCNLLRCLPYRLVR